MFLWFPEVLFDGAWTPLGNGFNTRDAAETAVGQWKQENRCFGDSCFRYERIKVAEEPPPEVMTETEVPW